VELLYSLKLSLFTLHICCISCSLDFLKLNLGWKYMHRVSKKKWNLRRLVQKYAFFVQLSWMVFYQYFLKICIFFGTPIIQWPKKNPQIFFSLKIKSSEKQKCVYKLFISKSKIKKKFTKKNSVYSVKSFGQLYITNIQIHIYK